MNWHVKGDRGSRICLSNRYEYNRYKRSRKLNKCWLFLFKGPTSVNTLTNQSCRGDLDLEFLKVNFFGSLMNGGNNQHQLSLTGLLLMGKMLPLGITMWSSFLHFMIRNSYERNLLALGVKGCLLNHVLGLCLSHSYATWRHYLNVCMVWLEIEL